MKKFLTTLKIRSRLPVFAVLLVFSLGGRAALFASAHGPVEAESPHGDGATNADTGKSIDLGEYRIRSYYPVQAQKSIVTFALHATAQPDQLADARRIMRERQNKVRDQVITATRLTPLAEFDDADLARFRRRVILRLRRTIPELPIDGVYVSNFELTVQSL